MSIYGDRLLARLDEKFGSFEKPAPPDELAAFSSPCPEFGTVILTDDGDETTVFVGSFTHVHFSADGDIADDVLRAEGVADDVVRFLENLFADRIEVYGNGNFGACRKVGSKPRGWLSKWLFGSESFCWSGPVK